MLHRPARPCTADLRSTEVRMHGWGAGAKHPVCKLASGSIAIDPWEAALCPVARCAATAGACAVTLA